MTSFKRACFAVVVLLPMAAYGSFGGAPCRADFACHFFGWGILIGTVGVPISAVIFAVLHLVFCNLERSKFAQFFVGGGFGVVAYEIAALFGALIGARDIGASDRHTDFLLMGFASAYLVLAFASVLYVRSTPRELPAGR